MKGAQSISNLELGEVLQIIQLVLYVS